MKTVIFIRHSKSSHTIEALADIHRPLNDRGYKDAQLVADALKNQKLKPQVIISSPAVRAISTALVFAQHLQVKYTNVQINESLYESGKAKIISLIKSFNNKLDCIILVGHNPDFEDTINSLIKTKIEKYPTTGVAIIEFKITDWNDINQSKSNLTKLLLPSQFSVNSINNNN